MGGNAAVVVALDRIECLHRLAKFRGDAGFLKQFTRGCFLQGFARFDLAALSGETDVRRLPITDLQDNLPDTGSKLTAAKHPQGAV